MNPKGRRMVRQTHKWVGLIGGVWLIVLGASGLLLDHREDWAWAWQFHIPDSWLPAETAEGLEHRHLTLFEASKTDSNIWVVGGAAGVWITKDKGVRWSRASFSGLDVSPMIYAMAFEESGTSAVVWLATSDGLWKLNPGNEIAEPAAFRGRRLTAMDLDAEEGRFVFIENRSSIIVGRVSEAADAVQIDTDAVAVAGLPDRVTWSRLLFDLHLGRGLVDRPASLLINDFGAVASILLPLSGFLYWYLGRRRGRKAPTLTPRRLLFRLHAPILGLLAVFPLAYLYSTGVVMNHRDAWIPTLVSNTIPSSLLPPVYQFRSLEREISHIVAYPGESNRFTIGTRLGVLTSKDGGQNWARELGTPRAPGFVWSLKRLDNQIFLGGLGGPSYYRESDADEWTLLPGVRGMPSDVTVSDEELYVMNGPTMLRGSLDSGLAVTEFPLPNMDTTPLMLLMFDLHSGDLIHPNFKFVLDALAIGTVLMIITGPILWWRRKW